MDKKVFVKELQMIFSDLNKKEKRYSMVWLSEENFGGLYYSGRYVLNVKMEHHITEISSEIIDISHLLRSKLDKEKYAYILRITVYNENEYIPNERGDIILYNDEISYNAA